MEPFDQIGSLSSEQMELLRLLLAEEGIDASRLPIPRAARAGGRAPASFAQQRLWFLHQLEPASPRYNVPIAVELRGPLCPGALAAALRDVVGRHEMLRTVFAEDGGAPVQVVLDALPEPLLQLPQVDLAGVPAASRWELLEQLLAARIDAPFDLRRAPLFRTTLFRLGAELWVLLLVVHHIATDAWSMSLWVEEIATAYRSRSLGMPGALPQLPVQYADFAQWQRQRVAGEFLAQEVAHWRQRLDGLVPLALPSDRPRESTAAPRCGTQRALLAPPLLASLHRLARSRGVTLFAVLTAALDILLARSCGVDDVAIGSPVAGRNRAEIERLIGFFVNLLVLRTRLAGEPTFAALLDRVQEVSLDALAHQELPFEKLVETLRPDRHLGETPFFSVLLTLQNVPQPELDLGGIFLRSLPVTASATRFDWILYAREESALELTLEYRAELFHATTCARALQHLESLLAAAAAAPETPISELTLLSAAERHQIASEWTLPRAAPEGAAEIAELFEGWAARAPAAPALVSDQGVWSYGELNARANRLARRLRSLGVGPDVPVALHLERSASMVLGLLAVLKAGGAYVPLEPPLPAQDLEARIAAAGSRIALTSAALAADLPPQIETRLCLDAGADALAGEATADLGLRFPEQALAYVIYTSGSTGRAKGVGIERGHLARYLRSALERLAPPPQARFALLSTFAADLGNTTLFAALCTGGCLHVLSRHIAADAEAVAAYGELHPIDCLKIVPSHLRALLTAAAPHRVLPRHLLILGGEACDRELLQRIAELAPACRVFNHYGPTETTVGVIAGRLTAGEPGGREPLGRPLAGARCLVLDRFFQPLPCGVPGELYVGGDTVARGYLASPGLTAERFLPDPSAAAPGARLYRTGDLVQLRWDGQLEFLGRVDRQVKIRGLRIEPEGIEALLREHPRVAMAAVNVAGSGSDRRLVAYVAAAETDRLTAGELRSFLGARLPEPMLPSELVILPTLPLGLNGKLDRGALPEPGLAARPATARRPATPLEEIVASVWCEILERDEIDVETDFFASGGHSLQATRVASRLSQILACSVPLRLLFEASTVARQASALADQMVSASRPALPAIVRRGGSEGDLPLSSAQERLWVLDRLSARRTSYLLHYFAALSGPLEPALLAAALAEVVRRHEVLRTCFPSREGRPMQVVLPPPRVVLPVIDLRGLGGTGDGAARAALDLAEEETRRPFDLAGELPWRALLVRRDDAEWTLLLTLHHIASDAWSRAVLVRELLSIYAGLVRGERALLPELPVQYADFALWQREVLRGETLAALLAYWQKQLTGCQGTELPTDRPRPPVQSYRGAALGFALPAPLVSEVHALAQRHLVTPFMVLLTALATLLHRSTGSSDIVIGSPVANRNHPQIEPLIGFFVNLLVLRVPAAAPLSFRDALEQTRRVALEAYTHQDLPFEKLLEELPLARDPGRQPLVQVVFAFQNTPTARLELADLAIEPFEVHPDTAKFDLSLLAEEGENGFAGALEYSTDLFDRTTIERFRHHWENLLAGAAREPGAALAELPLLTPCEAHQLLHEWNWQGPAAPAVCAHRLFAEQVRRTPAAPAVAWATGELSYSELDRRANRLARRLRARGVGPESRVGLCLPRSPEVMVALLAIWKAGGAYVPLDPGHPLPYLLLRIRDAGCAAVLGPADRLAHLVQAEGVEVLDVPLLDREEEDDDAAPPDLADPANLAYVLYTSGTTGEPKGVMVSHRALANYLAWSAAAYRVPVGGRVPVHSSLGFDLTVTSLLTPLVAGGTVVLLPEEHGIESLRRGLVETPGFSLVKLTPAHLELLRWQLSPTQAAGMADCLVIGGEALLSEKLSWFREHAPGLRLINEYGPTETVVGCAVYDAAGALAPGAVPIGLPIAGSVIHLVDADLRLVPLGAVGEILIGGECLGRGYLGRPAWTAGRWIPDPFGATPGGRLYRTGDLARRLADGQLSFLGRRDTQVKIRGHRIDLEEIEAALVQHPALRAAAVAALPDPAGHLELVGYVVAKTAPPPAAAELRRFLAARLPAVMVPARILPLPALPLTANGKVDRGALPRPEAQAPGGGSVPRNHAESVVAEVWRKVLHRKAVGLHENFFDLGGNSLLLVEVQERLRQAFGHEISALDLLQNPTVTSQAALFAAPEAPEAATPEIGASAGPAAVSGGDIAVIGLAGRFPGADTADDFWQALRAGRELIRFFSIEELEAAGVDPALLRRDDYVAAGGVLDGGDEFDADFFGQSPREAELTDPQQRLFLELAWTALEDAGHAPGLSPGRVGVFAGCSLSRYWLHLAARPDLTAGHEMQLVFSNDKDFLPTRTSYKLNLKGPSVAVQTACSSSLVAVHMACRSLLQGECEMALAGGVSLRLLQPGGYLYQEGGIASPDGHCRPFSSEARGTVSGDGLGIVVLKRLADAIADGDHVRAVIKGSAINNDGAAKVGYSAPSVDGQAAVVSAALSAAGVAPESISYVEAHGTGTALGDPVEVAALARALRGAGPRPNACAIGSVKSNIGHLDAASGIAGLIKTVLALEHRQLPPSLHFDRPNPAIDFASGPLYVNASLADWRTGTAPRRAGVSSFGIGGTNAHVVLEQAPDPTPAPVAPASSWQLLILSARSSAALARARAQLGEHLDLRPHADLADVAYTLQVGRRRFPHRLTLVCRSAAEAARALADPASPAVSVHAGEESGPPVVFLFPGQGAQHIRMALDLYSQEREVRRIVDEGAALLAEPLGLDLRRLLFPAPGEEEQAEERLRSTALAQPALFLVEYALARLWMSLGVTPELMVGHSLGEYVAACLAGVFRFEDALALVAARGRLMASCPPGAMLSVPLSEAELADLLSADLSLAAVNGPTRCVVSGPAAAIEAVEQRLEGRQVSCRRLLTSHAFHCRLVDPILEPFRELVERVPLHPPTRPLLSSVTGALLSDREATDPGYWTRQLRATVRFGTALRTVAGEPRRMLLEVGPGQALTSLVRHDPELGRHLAVASLPQPRHDQSDLACFLSALGRLWQAGVPIDWQAWQAGRGRRRRPLPTYPFERKRYRVEAAPAQAAAADPPRQGRVEGWYLHPAWKKTAPAGLLSPRHPSRGRPWLVLGRRGALGMAVGEVLRQRGESVVHVVAAEAPERLAADLYSVRAGEPGDFTRLLSELRREGRAPGYVLVLWSLEQERAAGETPLDLFCHGLLHLAQALALEESDGPLRLGLVSAGMHEITGEEELDPEQALLLGLCRCLSSEVPRLSCRSIDLSPAEVAAPSAAGCTRGSLASSLVDELLLDSPDEVVGYRHGHRWVEIFEPVDLAGDAAPPPPLREGGVYLITGGLGGVGFELASHLFTAVRARLVLVGRSPVPPPGEREPWLERLGEAEPTSVRIRRLQALEAAGAEVLAATADVSDPDQIREVVRQARERFGAIHGVIHAAGVPSGGLFATRTAERARAVLAPKVQGARALVSACADGELDFLVLCGSLRTVLGGAGRSDYVAANAFLDAFGYQQRRALPRTLTVTIDWDTWRDTGMSAEAAAALGQRPEEAFPTALRSQEGVEVFRRALAGGLPRLLVSTQDLATVRAQARDVRPELPASHRPAVTHTRPVDPRYVAPRTEAERVLVEIWEELLGVAPLGVQENFFELGGDSIVGLQVVARAKKRGLELSPRQVFEAQTIAELAAAAGSAAPPPRSAPRQPVAGPVPLTPIQRWFFSRPMPDRHHWNQSLLLRVSVPIAPGPLAGALSALLCQHDALGLGFREESGAWQASCAAPAAAPLVVDLSGLPPVVRGTALERAAASTQTSLDLGQPPLLRVVLFRCGQAGEDRLLLVAHHLVVDAISWRILLEDLEEAVDQLQATGRLELPPPSTSFAEWAQRLQEHAASPELAAELDHWLAPARRSVPPLPLDHAGAANLMVSARTVHTHLGAEETRDLLHASRTLHADVQMLLLCGLARVFERWTGSPRLLIDIEGHGREPLFADLDVSRTVGWFTTLVPLLLELPSGGDELAALRRIKEQAQSSPENGIGYGLLRYLADGLPRRHELEELPQPELKLLYLGQMDRALRPSSRFSEAPEGSGDSVGARAPRSHVLDVTARIFGGELHVAWTYSDRLHERRTIEGLAADLLEELRALAGSRTPKSEVYTPSDFPQAGLSASELDDLLAQLQDSEEG